MVYGFCREAVWLHVVVTGGCGFIGGRLVERLIGEGFRVTVLDNLSRASPRVLERLKNLNRVEVKIVDVRCFEKVLSYLQGEGVFHLAALTDAEESQHFKDLYWSVNVDGTVNVLEVASRKGMKMLFTSSAAVYGELERYAREDDPVNPANFYGVTKLEAEKKCLKYSDKIEVTILRLFNVYGEDARSGVIKNFLEAVYSGRPLTVYGDGMYVRDFIYVDDVVEGIIRAYYTSSKNPRILNIGSGKPVVIRDLAEFIDSRVGVGIVHREPRNVDVRYSVADISRALHELGWKPRVDLYDWILDKLEVIR